MHSVVIVVVVVAASTCGAGANTIETIMADDTMILKLLVIMINIVLVNICHIIVISVVMIDQNVVPIIMIITERLLESRLQVGLKVVVAIGCGGCTSQGEAIIHVVDVAC